ncbi:uncharacterized protein N7458_000181, partial [Penicillium daleae]
LIPLFGDPNSERGGVNRFVIEESLVEYSRPYYQLKMGFLCMITHQPQIAWRHDPLACVSRLGYT